MFQLQRTKDPLDSAHYLGIFAIGLAYMDSTLHTGKMICPGFLPFMAVGRYYIRSYVDSMHLVHTSIFYSILMVPTHGHLMRTLQYLKCSMSSQDPPLSSGCHSFLFPALMLIFIVMCCISRYSIFALAQTSGTHNVVH